MYPFYRGRDHGSAHSAGKDKKPAKLSERAPNATREKIVCDKVFSRAAFCEKQSFCSA